MYPRLKSEEMEQMNQSREGSYNSNAIGIMLPNETPKVEMKLSNTSSERSKDIVDVTANCVPKERSVRVSFSIGAV